jgi:hypothetical protein
VGKPGSVEADEKEKRLKQKAEYIFIDGLRFEKTSYGLVYCPEYQSGHRKHHCPDCIACAWCSDPRCAVCREPKQSQEKKKDLPCVR